MGSGDVVVLQNNLSDDLTITENSEFTFTTPISNGNFYDVTVFTQPTGKTCSVGNNEGYVSGSNITDARVACSASTFTVGGTVAGLTAADTLILQNNLDDDLTITQNGNFILNTSIAAGGMYDVTVSTQPEGKTCSVSSSEGYIAGYDISDVEVVCSIHSYTVGGNIPGYESGDDLLLSLNDNDTLSIITDGPFIFSNPLADESEYDNIIALGTMSKIDTQTNEIVATVSIGQFPMGTASDANGNVWVVNTTDHTLSKIDAMRSEVLGTIYIDDDIP